jgi:preprotein translocase subunit SecA
MKYLSQLINRARKFNTNSFKDSMNQYGMSEGERIHINIIGKLFESRLDVLKSQKNTLRKLITGASQ